MVDDALIQKTKKLGNLACLDICTHTLSSVVKTLDNNFMRLQVINRGGLLDNVDVRSTFLDQIKVVQFEGAKLRTIHNKVLQSKAKKTILHNEGGLSIRE